MIEESREEIERRMLDIVSSCGDDGISPGELVEKLVREGYSSHSIKSVFWHLQPCSGTIIRLTDNRRVVAL